MMTMWHQCAKHTARPSDRCGHCSLSLALNARQAVTIGVPDEHVQAVAVQHMREGNFR
jgi:hypothetical protein